ncbi:hypothetical protein ACFUN8_08995 [Streptomyces sp. NPDC057307]|uniref:hypothetical protein n=1 Tax=Streptomyces sp. NPDC057307 TaxID=3346096 RepID=UPI00363805A6
MAGSAARFAAWSVATVGLHEVLMLGEHTSEPIETARGGMPLFLVAPIGRAQESGDLRPEVTPSDIPVIQHMLYAAARFTRGQEPDIWRR